MLSFPAAADTQSDQDLIYRVAFGRAADVELLLQKGANANTVNAAGMPAILVAVMNRRPDDAENYGIVKALMDAGADPNTMGPHGELLIIEAVKKSSPEILSMLIDNQDVVLSVKDAYGKTLLDNARERKDDKVFALVSQGVVAQEQRLKDLQNPSNLTKMLQEYAFLNCANEYLNYYMGMDNGANLDATTFQSILEKNENEIRLSEKNIRKIFAEDMPYNRLRQIGDETKQAISNELDGMQSDKQRVFEGVGSDYDLNKRCKRMASKWSGGDKKQ
jgi:hypothetical protein